MASKRTPLLLLPQPRRVRRAAGTFKIADSLPLRLPPASDASELTAAQQLADDVRRLGVDTLISRAADATATVQRGIAVRRGKVSGGPEAYRLTVHAAGVNIVANTSRGTYYGIQTLRQLVRQFGRALPALAIDDSPGFPLRGVYHDISRGRVPTVDTIKQLIELLAHLKVNSLSLYIEYPYRYERHPLIWEDTEPLSAEDILEIQNFAALHHVDFVPSQASFGHLERLLSKKPYQHLANTPPRTLKTSRLGGYGGTSLDPTNPQSLKLLAELYEEFLPQFDSPYFNACCDEVWDLGDGKSAARAKRIGKGRLFADFIREIDRLSRSYGKRTMIWADIVKHHPEAAERIPKDVIMLNWWYYPGKTQEWMVDHSRAIRKSGHELVVCPGVNNWASFMPRTGQMRANIRAFAKAGQDAGAMGLLNTEWGDGGHFNLLATALPGFAEGAEQSWCREASDADTMGRRWTLHVLGDRRGDAERVITLADYGQGEYRQTFTGFGDERKIDFKMIESTPEKVLARQQKFNRQLMQAIDVAIGLGQRLCEEKQPAADPAFGFLAATEYAVLTALTLAKGSAVCGQMNKLLGRDKTAKAQFAMAADATANLLGDYEELWLRRNRRSELAWSMDRFKEAIRRWRRAAK